MIRLSCAAITEISRLKSRYPKPEATFRLGVQVGGCADFYYILKFEDAINPGDQVLNCGGIQVVVDAQSIDYVNGLTLDYSEDLMGGGFRFHNPNAVQSCGCGNSFTIGDRSLTY
jgi:iron-sulfur cluster assembly accessory protein